MRGIEKPYSYLVQNGFSETTATRIINGNVGGLNLKFVDRLCVLLKCTPNDLLGWKASKDEILPDEHPLNTLKRDDSYLAFLKLRKELPLDELEKLLKGK
jgi:hypothetical protein